MCDITGCGKQNDLPEIVLSSNQRRQFLKGLATLPLATVLAYPELSRAAASRTEMISITTATGRTVSAALAMPERATNAPAILLIHEWWGLNDQIKSVAQSLAEQGYVALAVDLYEGSVTTEPDEARSLMQSVNADHATDALVSWIGFLKDHTATSGKIGTIGWCFGGGWSLNASIATPVDATVIYYGSVKKTADDLTGLNSPVLGHFATQDGWIDKTMVSGFETAMQSAGKDDELAVHWYEAQHAFANPTSARYDSEDAALAWQRTLEFFQQNLS